MKVAGRMAPAAFGVLSLVVLSACEHRPVPAGQSTTRDSAGVTIVESTAPAWPAGGGYRIVERPLLDLGGVAGDSAQDFIAITDAVRLPSGRIAVADGGAGQVRVFDSRGVLLRRFGTRGAAPGEFRALMWIQALAGDTLAAWDRDAARLTVFAPDGRVARTLVLPDTAAARQGVGVLGSGTLLAASLVNLDSVRRTGVVRQRVRYWAIGPEGARREVGAFWSDELYVERLGNGVRPVRLPFGRAAVTAVTDDVFAYGDGSRYEIGVYGGDGRLRRSARRAAEPMPVTADDTTRVIAGVLAPVATPEERAPLRRFWSSIPYPRTMPAFADIVFGPGGELWVEQSRHVGERPQHDVFAPDGRWLGTVALPDRFTLYDVGRDYLLGRWKDADDVDHVRLYALIR